MLISKPTRTKQPHEANDFEGKRTDITSLYCLLKHFMVHELALKTEGRVLLKYGIHIYAYSETLKEILTKFIGRRQAKYRDNSSQEV